MDISERFIAFTSEDVGKAAVAGNAEVELNFGSTADEDRPAALRRKKLMLWRVEAYRATGVSATATTPQVYDTTGAATTAWATKYLGASTAAGTRFDVTNIGGTLYTGTDGKLFFKVNGDAADTYQYAVWFKVLL